MTGKATDPGPYQPHIRYKQELRAMKTGEGPGRRAGVVIVRDMWLTGFDTPSMHTMYVDKPMRSAG